MMKTKQSVRRTYVKPGTETVALSAVGALAYMSFQGNADNDDGDTKTSGTGGDGGGAGDVEYGGDLGGTVVNPTSAKGFSGGLDDVWD